MATPPTAPADGGASGPERSLALDLAQARDAAAAAPGDAVLRAALAASVRRVVAGAVQLHRAGRLASAERLYREVLQVAPDDPDALQLSGLVRHVVGDGARAAELIGRAIAVRSDVPWYHANLAMVHEALGRRSEALACREAVVRLRPDSADAHAALAESLKGLGRRYDAIVACERAWALEPGDNAHYRWLWVAYQELYAEHLAGTAQCDDVQRSIALVAAANTARLERRARDAEDGYRDAIALRPQAPFAASQLACQLAAEGRLAEADAIFRELARRHRYPNEVIRLDPAFVLALPMRTTPAPPAPSAEMRPGLVVFIAGDTGYFRQYAQPLLRSLRAASAKEWFVHVHVIDPDAWVAEEVQAMAADAGLARIAYSFERLDPAATPGPGEEGVHSLRTWYACSRFLQLPGLLARYACPIVVLDMDVIVLRDLQPLVDATADADVATIRLDPDRQRVWDELWVTLLVVHPTGRSLAYFKRVAAYIRHFLGLGRACWGLDQIALYAARAATCDGAAAPVFRWLPPRSVQGSSFFDPARPGTEYDAQAVLWSLTGSVPGNLAKRSLPAYRAHQPRLRRVYGWWLPGTDVLLERALALAPAEGGRKAWEPELMRACFRLRPRGRRAIDVGAHVGFWSAALAARFDRVEGFEPHPLMQDCFRRNVAGANVALHTFALGAQDGTMGIVFDADNSGMTHLAAAGTGQVRVARLDDFGYDDVDLVKVDAEGYERFVLAGAQSTLLRCRPLVVVEQGLWSGRFDEAPLAAVRFLESLGARVLDQPTDTDFVCGW